MSNVLLERFLKAVPQGFVRWLLSRQLSIYKQSIELAFNEQPWSKAEGITLLPYMRRALWEADFRNAAIQHSLKAEDSEHKARNSSCVLVKAGNIILTGHCVEGPNDFVREAESRKQNAGVNRWLTHYVDSRILTAPVPKLDERPIYINVLHGAWFLARQQDEMAVDQATCFLRFAIPAADSNQYLAGCNWSAQQLLSLYAPVAAAEPTLRAFQTRHGPPSKRKRRTA